MARCASNRRECVRVRDGRARSCLGCFKAKQKCKGAIWGGEEEEVEEVEGEAGRVGGPSGSVSKQLREISETLKELVEYQGTGIRAMMEVLEGLRYERDEDLETAEYNEWLEGFDEEEMGLEAEELWEEDKSFREWLERGVKSGGAAASAVEPTETGGEADMEIE
jgi:hypothetical protein